ncbi:MAG: putative membrane protein YeiH, partial [Flavobacteriales bacterium]
LCVGSLFAAVGAIYGLDAKVPYTTSFTLSDSLQITTFAGIILAIGSSVISDILVKTEKMVLQRNLMFTIWSLFFILHVGFNAYLISTSV